MYNWILITNGKSPEALAARRPSLKYTVIGCYLICIDEDSFDGSRAFQAQGVILCGDGQAVLPGDMVLVLQL